MKEAIREERPERSARGTFRMTIPAAVAYDPDGLKKSLAQLAERIGCGQCMSGANMCLISMERDFVLDARKQLSANPVGSLANRDSTVNVGLSSEVKYDIDKVFVAIDKVIEGLGSHPCISGFDLAFQNQINSIVIGPKLEATSYLDGF
jgi:hypothetical protein